MIARGHHSHHFAGGESCLAFGCRHLFADHTESLERLVPLSLASYFRTLFSNDVLWWSVAQGQLNMSGSDRFPECSAEKLQANPQILLSTSSLMRAALFQRIL